MDVTINGGREDAAVTLQRENGPLATDQLYVNDRRVVRVTHSRADDVPVILVTEDEVVVEVARQPFYTLNGMDYDWQPGSQGQPTIGSAESTGESQSQPA